MRNFILLIMACFIMSSMFSSLVFADNEIGEKEKIVEDVEDVEAVEDVDVCEGVDCAGHGTCSSDTGEAVCDCDDGYINGKKEPLSCVQECNTVFCETFTEFTNYMKGFGDVIKDFTEVFKEYNSTLKDVNVSLKEFKASENGSGDSCQNCFKVKFGLRFASDVVWDLKFGDNTEYFLIGPVARLGWEKWGVDMVGYAGLWTGANLNDGTVIAILKVDVSPYLKLSKKFEIFTEFSWALAQHPVSHDAFGTPNPWFQVRGLKIGIRYYLFDDFLIGASFDTLKVEDGLYQFGGGIDFSYFF